MYGCAPLPESLPRVDLVPEADTLTPRMLVQIVLLATFAGLLGDAMWILYGGVTLILYALERILSELRRGRLERMARSTWTD